MKETVESLIKKANTLFEAGNQNKALLYYQKALHDSKALPLVIEYIKKNKDNLEENQYLLKDLLQTKYHILLLPEAFRLLLNSIKKQVEKQEEKIAYQRFKKSILSKHPTTPEQYVDILLEQNENPFWQEIQFLSTLLLEHGFNYYLCDVDQLCHQRTRARELARFERSLQEKKPDILTEIDSMTGYEFEDFLIDLFTRLGHRVEQRKRSHEQGLDFLLERQGEKIACQVKRYTKPVGNKAIQEANAARDYYRCQRALVITNSIFTKSAIQLAERCKVELWDRNKLKELIEKRR
jgi:HJR/Mrr/RecB family endonuclease